ncbi:ShlB/FhaC/HecB family hemolysin secretion/activation protein [Pleurocapsa sp. PCC 7319]|uniref:ShlB/FhaC/HecB family hemolysin secretion/activation protein n=1 Tax=Pleurocapsa sp. PCC 7319 TaxID=118161 RepID=UPI00034A22B6|nr:ShlB/FhaC/HecB family hemolysin secretion/activation protein [Pleurocapsa sp. PCC 7319]
MVKQKTFIHRFKVTKIPLLSIVYLLTITKLAKAQDVPEPPTPPLPPPTQPEEPETLPSLEEILPELENQPTPDNSDTIKDILNTVFVKKFEIVDSTVFTPEELAVVLKPYTLRRLSFTEILAAQQAIDRLYVQNGYITSGTFLPPQKLENGIITIEVVEGTLEEINISGLNRLNSGYVRSRLEIATNAPLNRDKLLNALQLLQLDPLIENLAAELTAGTRQGSSILELNLQEADPFDLTLSFDNFRAPSVGTDRRSIQLTHRNLLGLGDRFSIGYLNTDGSNSLNDLNYTVPFNPYNGTLNFRFSLTDSQIITSPFDQFDIESENTNYEFTYRQPILQKPTQDLALGLTFARNNSLITLGGEPEQLSRGAEVDGETKISALRFFQEYTRRDANQVFALLSQFSLGIDVFDATINNNEEPDSKFFAWRGQAQYLRLLNPTFTLLLRSDLQIANKALVPTEQFSLGGGLSVRGYRQDALLGDNGWFNSAEIRATILRLPQWETTMQLTPFVDFGKVWNSDDLDDLPLDTNTLFSVGVGLRLQVSDYFAARLDWGIPLVDLDTAGDSLQEEGVYFSLELKPF